MPLLQTGGELVTRASTSTAAPLAGSALSSSVCRRWRIASRPVADSVCDGYLSPDLSLVCGHMLACPYVETLFAVPLSPRAAHASRNAQKVHFRVVALRNSSRGAGSRAACLMAHLRCYAMDTCLYTPLKWFFSPQLLLAAAAQLPGSERARVPARSFW